VVPLVRYTLSIIRSVSNPEQPHPDLPADSPYSLRLFTDHNFSGLQWETRGGRSYLRCLASGKAKLAKPEEIVRQLMIHKLVHDFGYPIESIQVEKPVYFGSTVHKKAADIVIFDRDDPSAAYIIVECKKPKDLSG